MSISSEKRSADLSDCIAIRAAGSRRSGAIGVPRLFPTDPDVAREGSDFEYGVAVADDSAQRLIVPAVLRILVVTRRDLQVGFDIAAPGIRLHLEPAAGRHGQ